MQELGTDRRTEFAWLAAVLVIAAGLRLWRLEDNGVGTQYYAAGVRSLLQSGTLFFYNAFDPAGFVSLDKPPGAFWIQAAFAKLLGYSGWTLHLPQALAGTASVALLYRLVRRPFGAAAGLGAALLMAITPIAVAIDRSNNTDSWLVFFLLLAAWAALRGRGLSIVLSMALLGIAFNVKMMAALVAGPALAAAWWMASERNWRERLGWMTVGGVVLVAVSLSWSVAFELTPKSSRPYAGSTTGNSMLELIVVHNGLERFVRTRPPAPTPMAAQTTPTSRFPLYDAVPVGPLRLAQPTLASQFSWLMPFAAFALLFAWHRRAQNASLALWGVWALTYGIVYSAAGGIFHAYYLSALAPPLAALAGIGAAELWRRGPRWLAAALIVTAAWQAYVLGAGALGWDTLWMLAPAGAALAAAAVWLRNKPSLALPAGLGLLVLPVAWALSPIFSPGNFTLPSASLPRWLGANDGRGPILSRNYAALSDDPKLIDFLQSHRGQARYLLATPTASQAAPVIVRTGEPVMAFGGFSGRDPILTVEDFAQAARRGDVRYVLIAGRESANPIVRWVRSNGTRVDESEWRSTPTDARRQIALYDLTSK